MNNLSKRLRDSLVNPPFTSNRKTTSFYPSSVSVEVPQPWGTQVIGACLRQQYYRMNEEPTSNPGNPDYMISALLGDKVSELLVYLLDTYGFQMGIQRAATEHSFQDPRLNLSGRSDIIVWDYVQKELAGIEVKSVGAYKAAKTIEAPAEEHIMQAVLYLDFYRTFIKEGDARPKKWYIWYFSRTENYSIKGKKHGSPLEMIWDFFITLDSDDNPVVHTPTSSRAYKHLNLKNIHERFNRLKVFIDTKTLPPRDYDIAYSEEKLTTLYKCGQFTRKADEEKIQKWLDKGAKEGKLKLEMGDFECQLCVWKDKCWNISKDQIEISLSNIKKSETEITPEIKESFEKLW